MWIKSSCSSETIFQSSCEKQVFIKSVKFPKTNFKLVNIKLVNIEFFSQSDIFIFKI